MRNWKLAALVMAVAGGVALGDAQSKPLYEVKCPAGYTLKGDLLNPHWFQCDKAGTTVTTSPTCPSGYTYEIRDGLYHDRCNKVVTETRAVECRLLITDNPDNWRYTVVSGQFDECRSIKGKQPVGVKCPLGWGDPVRDGAGAGRDNCQKRDEVHADVSCPAGYSYRSQGGKDSCEKAGTSTTVKPTF